MASWKKVIVSGSQAHLQSVTASGGVSASGDLSITGISTLTGRLTAGGAISTTNITASGNISSSAGLIGQTLSISGAGTIGGLLTVTGAITTTTITASGNISSSGNLIVTGNITASGLPSSTTPQIVGYNTTTGGLSYFDTSSIVAGAAAAVQTFKTISVGGVNLEADSSTDTLTIASGSFGGVATTRNNLRLSGSQDDTLTISFLDSPTFTQITASGNISSSAGLIGQTLTTSGNVTVGNQLSVTSGTISTTSTGTATIFNTNASQIDMGGAASIVNIGGTSTQTNFNGSVQLGNNSGDQITLGGGATDTVTVQGLFTIYDNLLNSNLIPFSNNSVVIGSSSKAIQSIVVNQITASGLPQTAPDSRQILMIDPTTGAVVRVTAASLSGSVGVDSFRTISIGGVGGSGGSVVADSSTDTLNISSSDANLTIAGNGTTDTITFDFADSPIFTHITASGNISASGNLTVTGNSTIGGTLGVTGLLTATGTITTTNLTASGNISSSGNLSVTGTSTLTGNSTIGGNLSVNGNTTLGNEIGDTVTVNAQTVTLQNPLVSTANVGNILVLTSSNRIATQSIDTRVFGTTLISGSGAAGQIAYFNATTGIAGDSGLTYDASSDTLTINGSTFGQNVTIAGNLTVNGNTTILNTTELLVEDKFIILASGSIAGSPQDSGIIVQTTTGSNGIGSGSALFLNGAGVPSSGTSRWGLAQNIPHDATSVTPTDYIMSVSSSAADPTLAPTYGSASAGFGNVHINTQSKTIWMYI